MKKLFLVVAFLVSQFTHAADDMSQVDWTRQAVVTTAMLVDFGQTRDIIRRGYNEYNPLIDHHRSDVYVRNYFAIAIVGHAVVTKNLPKEWRPAFQYGTLALETFLILHNRRIGVKVTF